MSTQPDIANVLATLERELVGLAPVKGRIRDIAALLAVDRLRTESGLSTVAPTLHMCFTGNPGTGKTTVALRMAEILCTLGYVRRRDVTSVTRDDLVGQFIGHTAPKTREVLKRAKGGCSSSTRRTTSTGPRTSATTGRRRSRSSCRPWRTSATISS